jgi:hypothetical protein
MWTIMPKPMSDGWMNQPFCKQDGLSMASGGIMAFMQKTIPLPTFMARP